MKKVFFGLLLSIGFLFMFFLGISVSGMENIDYDKITEYENIKIYAHKNFDEKRMNLYIENLETIPESLLNNCENIYFTGENLSEKFNLDIEAPVVAVSDGADIYVSTNYYSDDVLIHEFFHVYDYTHFWVSDKEDFLKLYEKYKDVYHVSPGNVENSYEFFASYGELFSLANESLEKNELYTFFSELNLY